jgi:hypothetical protein
VGDSSDRLVNGEYEIVLGSTGTVTLPEGGTITEGVVTENPTIQLTPASPDVASQKLVIKGGIGDNYHLHLTNGDLTETSLIIGTDEHNIRTITDGGVGITTYDYSVQEQKYWYFSPQGSLTFPDITTQTTAHVQGEYIYEFDGVNTNLTITDLNFNLLFCTPAVGYSGSDTHNINLPNGTLGQRLVIINVSTFCTLTVNSGYQVTANSGPAELIYTTNEGWFPLYGIVSGV